MASALGGAPAGSVEGAGAQALEGASAACAACDAAQGGGVEIEYDCATSSEACTLGNKDD